MSILNKIHGALDEYYWKFCLNHINTSKLKKIIIFESAPDLSDNTKAVFDEMIRRGINKKYKLVWCLHKSLSKEIKKIKNVYYLASWYDKYKYFDKKARMKICCNRFLDKSNEKQICIYLSHGSPIKSTRNYYNIPDWIDYNIVQSEKILDVFAYEARCDKKRTIPLGYPRNDVFKKEKIDIHKVLETKCKKIIIWYPTYRKHKYGNAVECGKSLPLIHNRENAEKVNKVAKEKDILIVLKPHFAQDVSCIKNFKLSNIRFIDDEFFADKNISSYQLLGASDALVTDYSSTYYDFTLCNKPVALIWEDIEQYKENPGLVKDYEYLTKGAEKIYSTDEFIEFLDRIDNNIDKLKKDREEIRDYVNFSTDGKNSKRVVDFIMKIAES